MELVDKTHAGVTQVAPLPVSLLPERLPVDDDFALGVANRFGEGGGAHGCVDGDAVGVGARKRAARGQGAVLGDRAFWGSVLTTMLYVVLSTLGTTLLGLIVAMVMNRKFPLRWLARSLILLPYVAPVISVVFAWQFFFDPVNGIFMHILVEELGSTISSGPYFPSRLIICR